MRIYTILILILFSFGIASAQSEKGVLIVVRPSINPSPRHVVTILANGEIVAKLKNGSFASKELPVGEYLITSDKENPQEFKVTILPNDTAFVKTTVSYGEKGLKTDFSTINSNEVNSSNQKLHKSAYVYKAPVVYEEKDFTLGLIIGTSVGFESINVFENSHGSNYVVSTGSGFTIGAELVYKMSKTFEAHTDIRYHSTGLMPAHKDVWAYFQNGSANLTAYALAPIKSKYIKLKFGLGGCMGFGANMSIDATSVGLNKIEANYKPSYGYRVGAIIESKFDRNAYFFAMHYNNLTYQFGDAKVNGTQAILATKDLSNPIASGLDISIGIRFNL